MVSGASAVSGFGLPSSPHPPSSRQHVHAGRPATPSALPIRLLIAPRRTLPHPVLCLLRYRSSGGCVSHLLHRPPQSIARSRPPGIPMRGCSVGLARRPEHDLVPGGHRSAPRPAAGCLLGPRGPGVSRLRCSSRREPPAPRPDARPGPSARPAPALAAAAGNPRPDPLSADTREVGIPWPRRRGGHPALLLTRRSAYWPCCRAPIDVTVAVALPRSANVAGGPFLLWQA